MRSVRRSQRADALRQPSPQSTPRSFAQPLELLFELPDLVLHTQAIARRAQMVRLVTRRCITGEERDLVDQDADAREAGLRVAQTTVAHGLPRRADHLVERLGQHLNDPRATCGPRLRLHAA